jgi:ankyrin repeat protein
MTAISCCEMPSMQGTRNKEQRSSNAFGTNATMNTHDDDDDFEDYDYEDDEDYGDEERDEFDALLEEHLRRRAADEEGGGERTPRSRDSSAAAMLRVRDPLGFLPLHSAIFYNRPPSTIENYLEGWPESIRERTGNEYKDLPVHLACRALALRLDADESSDDEIEGMRQIVRILAEKWPECLEETNSDGHVPLHLTNDAATVRYLLQKCPDAIRQQDNHGMIPLHIGTTEGYPLEVVSLFVEHWRESVRAVDNMGRTALHHVSATTPTNVIRFLTAQGQDALMVADSDGNLPLHCALNYEVDHPSMMLPQQLALIKVSPSAAVRATSRDGCLPLLLAVRRRLSTRVVKALLIAWPESIRERSTAEGLLALHEAAFVGNVKLVRYLLGLWPESIREHTTAEGRLALHKAVLGGSRAAANVLLKQWPESIREKTRSGWLPIHLAVCLRPANLDECRSVVTMAEDLLQRFPESIGEATDDDKGYLPLHAAVSRGRAGLDFQHNPEQGQWAKKAEFALVCKLVKLAPTTVRTPSKEGMVPLQYAIRQCMSPAAVQVLVERYPESLQLTIPHDDRTALHMAVARSEDPSLPMVQNVVAQRPQLLHEADREGSLPVHVALAHKQPLPIVRFLVQQHPESLETADTNGSSRPALSRVAR